MGVGSRRGGGRREQMDTKKLEIIKKNDQYSLKGKENGKKTKKEVRDKIGRHDESHSSWFQTIHKA